LVWLLVTIGTKAAIFSAAMSAWHELVEREHELHNPTSAEKVRLAGTYLRLGRETVVLDVACGTAGPALVLAREFGCRVHGVDVSATFIEAAQQRIAEAQLADRISVEIGDAAETVFEPASYDVALCLGAAFIWGHIGDAAAALIPSVGRGGAVAVGEPFWQRPGREERGFVDLPWTVARFESAGVDLTGIVAASDDDWDRYKSLQWRAAVETGDDEVMKTHRERRDDHLSARRGQLGWAIFTGLAR
jgi:SAM-dependent methyltransferase